MGTWTLAGLTPDIRVLNDASKFGHEIHVYLKLRYDRTLFGQYEEVPKLDWHERIIMKEHHKREYWIYDGNMYDLKPKSPTMRIWAARYSAAYCSAVYGDGMVLGAKGCVRFLKLDGTRVRKQDVTLSKTKDGRIESVTSYLKKHGGFLEIDVCDIPSITDPKHTDPGNNTTHKERLLMFNIGLVGNKNKRLRLYQYLHVNAALPKHKWDRSLDKSHTRVLMPEAEGYRKVPPPADVTKPSPRPHGDGEMFP